MVLVFVCMEIMLFLYGFMIIATNIIIIIIVSNQFFFIINIITNNTHALDQQSSLNIAFASIQVSSYICSVEDAENQLLHAIKGDTAKQLSPPVLLQLELQILG